jgi:DNA helicase-4
LTLTIRPPLFAHLLGCRWTALTLSPEGLHLGLKGTAPRIIPWNDLADAQALQTGRAFHRLTLPPSVGDQPDPAVTEQIAWLARWKTTFWQAFSDGLHRQQAPQLEQALRHIETEVRRAYIRRSSWQQLQAQAAALISECDAASPQPPSMPSILYQRLRRIARGDEALLQRYREHYIQHQQAIHRALFEQVESLPLTSGQQRACITLDDCTLVLAGAGTGKTSTLIGRVAYLIASQQARPEQILLLAFGRQAANEMQQRLHKRLGIELDATTFHALGQRIITAVEGVRPRISPLVKDTALFEQWFGDQFEQHLSLPDYGSAVADYLLQYEGRASDCGLAAADGGAPIEQPRLVAERLADVRERGMLAHFQRLLAQLLRTDRARWLDDHRRQALIDGNAEPERLAQALALLQPLHQAYRNELSGRGEIDFDDMIGRALEYVEQGRFRPGWQHILVDEFQDISEPRARLIRALREAGTGATLFGVGDDWQSIYRFTGSDVQLTTGFGDFFGPASVTALERTFRFNNRISEVATAFVMQNPAQLPKQLQCETRVDQPAVSLLAHAGKDAARDPGVLESVLQAITQRAGPGSTVLLLARNRFSLPDSARLKQLQQAFPGLSLHSRTLHAAKGQEADIAIILGLDGGRYGFPATRETHPLLEALLPGAESFPHAEERRLFYVALTRARSRAYLLYNQGNPSSFVTELISAEYPVERGEFDTGVG